MKGYENDPAAALVSLIILLGLCGVAFFLSTTLIALVSLYLLGWGLTYGSLRLLDRLGQGWISDNGFWALGIGLLCWAGLAWLFFPLAWLRWLAINLNLVVSQAMIVGLAALLGLSWGGLSLFLLDGRDDGPTGEDEHGLRSFERDDNDELEMGPSPRGLDSGCTRPPARSTRITRPHRCESRPKRPGVRRVSSRSAGQPPS